MRSETAACPDATTLFLRIESIRPRKDGKRTLVDIDDHAAATKILKSRLISSRFCCFSIGKPDLGMSIAQFPHALMFAGNAQSLTKHKEKDHG